MPVVAVDIWTVLGSLGPWAIAAVGGATAATAWISYRAEHRPVVLVWAQFRAPGVPMLEIRIANVGTRPATDVVIAWREALPETFDRPTSINALPMWDGIPLLVPGDDVLRVDLGTGPQLLKGNFPTRYAADVTYRELNSRRRFSSLAEVDVEIFRGTAVSRIDGS